MIRLGGTCVLALGLFGWAGPVAAQITADQAVERARAAVRFMASLDRGFTDLSEAGDPRVGLETATDLYWVFAGRATVSVERRTGRITTFKVMLYQEDLVRRREDPAPRLTIEQAKEVCRSLYRLSDDRFPLAFTSYTESDAAFSIWARSDVGPIPLWDTREHVFEIDRHRGLVRWAELGYPPDLAFKNAPPVPDLEARQSAVEAYARHRPYARATVRGPWLALAVPEFDCATELTPEHGDLAAADRAIPVYVAFVADREAFSPALQSWARFQYVFVDARDGRAIAIYREIAPSMNYQRLDGSAARGLAGWTVARLPGESEDLAVSLTPRANPVKFMFAGRRVQFVSGDELVCGDYDRFLRVLRVRLEGGDEWYEVSGPFAERLALAPPPARRFGSGS